MISNDKITTLEIEDCVARYWGIRQHIIVPNISWGLSLHECDLLIVNLSGYATEIEIKISKGDLINDKKKKHEHKSSRIKRLYFAIPDYLNRPEIIEHIPLRAGIILINQTTWGLRASTFREAETNKLAIKLTEHEIFTLARLGSMRIWGLKHGLICQINTNKSLRAEIDKFKTP